jgi:hypothetical protein
MAKGSFWPVIQWWYKLAFSFHPAPHKTAEGLRFYRVLEPNMPLAVAHGQIEGFRAYIDLFWEIERSTLSQIAQSSAKYQILKMPVPYLGFGLVNGGRSIPPKTLVAAYLSDSFEFHTANPFSNYIFNYGACPSLGKRIVELDGEPRLLEHVNLNASYVNHKCKEANCEYEWIHIFLVVRTKRWIQPYEQLTAQYQTGSSKYFHNRAKTQKLAKGGFKVCPCLCDAPLQCPLGRSLINF